MPEEFPKPNVQEDAEVLPWIGPDEQNCGTEVPSAPLNISSSSHAGNYEEFWLLGGERGNVVGCGAMLQT